MTEQTNNAIQLYTAKNGTTELTVRFEQDTVWLSEQQMATLFGRDRTTINRHISNVFKDKELDEKSNVQKMHTANADRPTSYYNLDVIISVGYRVKSQEGTQFRIWATNTLKKYLIDGYALNQKRLQEKGIEALQKTLALVQKTLGSDAVGKEEALWLLEVITGYTKTWNLIQRYDEETLESTGNTKKLHYKLDAEEAYKAIKQLKIELEGKCNVGNLFANLREVWGLEGIFGNIYQTFDKKELYTSVEEKAAHLLYFIVKDHPFYDGNKRSAAFVFILFLAKNGILYDAEGNKKINDRALVAITIMIAESDPKEKDLMVRLVMNLVN